MGTTVESVLTTAHGSWFVPAGLGVKPVDMTAIIGDAADIR